MITIDLPQEIQELWTGLTIGYFQERFVKKFGFMPRSAGSGQDGSADLMRYYTNQDVDENELREFVLNPNNYEEPEGDCLQLQIKRGVVEDYMNLEFQEHDVMYVQAGNTQRVYFTPPLSPEEKEKARNFWRQHIDFV